MSGHSSEEKLKILYEDSLREIKELAVRMEDTGNSVVVAADIVKKTKFNLHSENERLLIDAIREIKASVNRIIGVQENINKTVANAALTLLTCEGGPINKLDDLVRKQQEALGWINRATKFYENAYVTKPMLWALIIGGLTGGIAGGIVGSIFMRWHL
jgi:hypothetical protein